MATPTIRPARVNYFTAPWCAPCKKFLPLVERAAAAAGLRVNVFDIDTPGGAMAAVFHNVTGVPTVIVEHVDARGDRAADRFGVLPLRALRERLTAWASER